jgi:hypothetical protein
MNDTNLCYRRFDLNTGSEDVGVYGVMDDSASGFRTSRLARTWTKPLYRR